MKLDVREAAIDDLAGLVRTSVMAGDQTYDAAYIKGDHLNGIITDGCVLDLTNVDGLNLDKPGGIRTYGIPASSARMGRSISL